MRKVSKKGVQGGTFGVMEGTIMMLGVLLGLSVTGNRFVVVLGLLTAGIADAFANAASFYVSEESEMIHTRREMWKAARLCFLGTFLTVIAVTIPIVAIKDIGYAIVTSFIVGLIILFFLGKYMAKKTKSKSPAKTIVKYILVGILTAVICFTIGRLIEYLVIA
jgi:VIT1/CCC1 family predicted Fe2+/Mn2+ transporter